MEMDDVRRELQLLLEKLESRMSEAVSGLGSSGKCVHCGWHACRCRARCAGRPRWPILAAVAAVVGVVAASKLICRNRR